MGVDGLVQSPELPITDLPVLDISAWLTGTNYDTSEKQGYVKQETVQHLRRACEETGFFALRFAPTVVNGDHDSSSCSYTAGTSSPPTWVGASRSTSLEETITLAAAAGRGFFRRGLGEKMAVRAGPGQAYGYFPMESEALGYSPDVAKKPDLREAFSMGPEGGAPAKYRSSPKNPPSEEGSSNMISVVSESTRAVLDFCFQPTPWPADKNFQSTMTEFYRQSSGLGAALLQVVALALGLEETHFDTPSAPGEHCNSARAIWYPQLLKPAAENQFRCGPHSDTGAVTLLWTDGPGLEIEINNIWTRVTAPPDCFIVNIGDLLERVSARRVGSPAPLAGDGDVGEEENKPPFPGRKWRSTPHRVPAPGVHEATNRDRLVLVLFLILAPDFEMEPGLTQGEYIYQHFLRWGRNKDGEEGAEGVVVEGYHTP